MPRLHRLAGAAGIGICSLTLTSGALATSRAPDSPAHRRIGDDDTSEVLTRQLREALGRKAGLAVDQTLRGLRALRDPSLMPLFSQLAGSDRLVLAKHGILGMAELENPPKIDLLMVAKIPSAAGKLDVLGEGLRAGLLSPDQLSEVAMWPKLEESMQVLIIGRLARSGSTPDASVLETIAKSGGDNITPAALLACVELRQIKDGPRVDAPLDKLLESTAPERDLALGRLLEHIRQERLTGSADLVKKVLDRKEENADIRLAALAAALAVAPTDKAVEGAWSKAVESGGLADRIRLGLIGLEEARERRQDKVGPLAASYFAALKKDKNELVKAIGTVGAAMEKAGDKATDKDHEALRKSVLELVAERHLPTLDWAERSAKTFPPADAAAVRVALIEASRPREQNEGIKVGAYEVAVRAARAAADTDPGSLGPVLSSAAQRNDEATAAAVLYGALQSVSPGAVDLAGLWEQAAGAGAPRALSASSLAKILRARHSDNLTPAQGDELASIARVGNGLPEPARVQAAWLALRARGQDRTALARIMADER
jgi:hypothetical protein